MQIKRMLFCAGVSAFFFDDQRAIKAGAQRDCFNYPGRPVTPGFRAIRQPGEAISILIELEDGRFAVGDAAAVQYSGTGGRDPLFLAENDLPLLEKQLAPLLAGRAFGTFREAAAWIDEAAFDGRRLHTALRYGLSQALLEAEAMSRGELKCETLRREYKLAPDNTPVPIFGQSGDDRYLNADKMILKQCDVLPHALINNVDEKLGRDGGKLADYLGWLAGRIRQLRTDESYRPALHIDVYGTPGLIFDHDAERIAAYLHQLETFAGEFPLYIEGPVDMGEKEAQMAKLKEIRDRLQRRGAQVKIVADEWCNTLEDIRDFTDLACCDMVQIKTPDLGSIHHVVESVLYCRKHGMAAYQGGTCNETDVSARACVHVALAARPERMLAKPGMGFDEGFSIVKNEMNRALTILNARTSTSNRESCR